MSKNRLDYQAQLSRHSHDIHGGYTSSMSTGAIIPQYFHILGPGDTIYYSSHMFARLQDVVTAFLGEIDIHIDSFFVPLQMLYTPFGQIFAQTDDLISSVFNTGAIPTKDQFPLLDVDSSLDQIDVSEPDPFGFESSAKNIFRLVDALDLNPLGCVSDTVKNSFGYQGGVDDQLCHNPKIAPWIVCAYNAIYQKFYRNDELEKLFVSRYNFDNHYQDSTFSDLTMFYTRYVQRPKDYFTDIRVSPIASAVNSFAASSFMFPSNGGLLDSYLSKVDSFLDGSSNVYGFISPSSNPNRPTLLSGLDPFDTVSVAGTSAQSDNQNTLFASAANIRALFAVDKFVRIYGRTDKTYDDQILAHFGIHIPHDVKHDLTHLSHYRAVLQSDPIYGTANTVAYEEEQASPITALGQVGGQGSCDFTSKQDKFTAPVHGVFMIVAYAVTKPRYIGTFSKLHLLTDRLSFPIPEYDKLGAQPVYGFEASPQYFYSANSTSQRIGWQNRYSQFKKKYNRASFYYYNGDYGHQTSSVNSYGPWVISRSPYYQNVYAGGPLPVPSAQSPVSKFINAEAFFERPDSLDCVMVKKFDSVFKESWFDFPHLILQSDPIVTEYMCDAKLVSWMSETGDPDL